MLCSNWYKLQDIINGHIATLINHMKLPQLLDVAALSFLHITFKNVLFIQTLYYHLAISLWSEDTTIWKYLSLFVAQCFYLTPFTQLMKHALEGHYMETTGTNEPTSDNSDMNYVKWQQWHEVCEVIIVIWSMLSVTMIQNCISSGISK